MPMSTEADQHVFFNAELLLKLNKQRIPHHVALIPDGNRRWAKKQAIEQAEGHTEGAHNLLDIVLAAKEIGIKVITFYIFSTENWLRDKDEVDFLLCLLQTWLIDKRPTMLENGVRLHSIGDLSPFQQSVIDTLEMTKQMTSECNEIDMVIAINYGGRNEILRGVRSICKNCTDKNLKPEEITEDLISQHLDTAFWKDPDLLIRTGGEYRMSNFLIWQTSYTELYFAEIFWPEFTPQHLLNAVFHFQQRERRWGGA